MSRVSVGGLRWVAPIAFVAMASMAPAYAQQPADASATQESPSKERGWWPPFTLAVGPGVEWQVPTADGSSANIKVDLVTMVMRRRGLLPAFRFGVRSRRSAMVDATDGSTIGPGRLDIHPWMGGVSYVYPIQPRLSGIVSGLMGYSVNRLDRGADDETDTARLVLPGAVTHVENSVAWEVGGRLWYELGPRVNLVSGLTYLHTRPTLTLANQSTYAWNADQVRIEVGLAFTVFRKK